MNDYDVIVIGTGIAGGSIAAQCAAAGLNVAVTDSLPCGDTCAQRGCDPKKVRLAASEAVSRAQGLARVTASRASRASSGETSSVASVSSWAACRSARRRGSETPGRRCMPKPGSPAPTRC